MTDNLPLEVATVSAQATHPVADVVRTENGSYALFWRDGKNIMDFVDRPLYSAQPIADAEAVEIRARLHRLSEENAELRGMVAEWRTKAATFEAERDALEAMIAEINEHLSDVEENEAAWMRRAKYAEDRIEKAPKVKVRGKIGEVCTIHVSHDLAGERVALLKLEDGERE